MIHTIISTEEVTSKNDKEGNQRMAGASLVNQKERQPHDVSPAIMTPVNHPLPKTLRIPQAKIDETDRRQIEAQNEGKSHTTKEELDDIKRTHYKEKKKKEQSDFNAYEAGLNSEQVRK